MLVQEEQNPLAGILLTDLLETPADLFFPLVRWKRQHALSVERIELGRRCIDFHQRPGDL